MKLLLLVVLTLCYAVQDSLSPPPQDPEARPELVAVPPMIPVAGDTGLFLDTNRSPAGSPGDIPGSGSWGRVEVISPGRKLSTYSARAWRPDSKGRFRIIMAHDPKRFAQPGPYTLTYIYSGKRTRSIQLSVVEVPDFKLIRCTLQLKAGRDFPRCLASAYAILTVHNNATQPIMFAHLEQPIGAMYSFKAITRSRPPYYISVSNQRGAAYIDWDYTEERPTATPVTLQPGETYVQNITLEPLSDAYLQVYHTEAVAPPGRYQVTVGRLLYVLIGDRHGPIAGVYPLRIEPTLTREFIVPRHKR